MLYKDDDVLVIDKPAGLAVQGGSGLSTSVDDLLDALQFDAKERPRLVHRLDRDTSGVLALARNAARGQASDRSLPPQGRAQDLLGASWSACPKCARGRIDAPLQKAGGKGAERVHVDEEGKRAVTEFAMIEKAGKKAAWLALMPVTGRTHQLRAHCVALGTPILGDGKYAGGAAFLAKDNLARQLHLHARRLRLPHPKGKGWIDVTAPLPEHMRKTWSFFGFAAKPEHDPFADLDA